jgi:hypothetical protein
MATKRKKRRHRGAAGKANADLGAHIQSLGLATVTQYQTWCRERGFSGALNKSWQERRQERKISDQVIDTELAERELLDHIRELGLTTVAEYTAWCTSHGLSTGSHKSNSQRKKEVALASRLKSDAVLAKMKDYTRRPQETIRAIYEGKLSGEDLNRPHLEKVQIAFDDLGRDHKARHVLLQLLLHVEKRGDFFDVKPAIVRLGPQYGNSFIEALGVLASWHKRWLRDPVEWRPDTHNARKQFGALARHLLAKYDVPTFMDMAWFLDTGDEAKKQQEWFVHIGTGGNIRKAEIPVTLTKKMAHLFLESPDDYTIYEAFRRGQVLGLGGEEPLVRALNGTQLGTSFEYEGFWHKVVHFFVNNPMLDPDEVGPLVDYIYNQKYVFREETVNGKVVQLPPEQPNFSIKARSIVKLLRQVDMWHRQLARLQRLPARVWAPSGLEELDWTDTDKYGNDKEHWTITELLTAKELQVEGAHMHHCVGSYVNNCKKGKTSVWSMQVTGQDQQTHRVMTIALQNGGRSITQARGKCNPLPSGKIPSGSKRRDFNKEYERHLRKSRHVLFLWREQEGLSMSKGL